MKTLVLEIRDRATFIPILAIKMAPEHAAEKYLLRRAGYGTAGELVLLGRLDGNSRFTYDIYAWGDRTYATAHKFIQEHFDELQNGEVIDVEYILGESATKKISEQHEAYL